MLSILFRFSEYLLKTGYLYYSALRRTENWEIHNMINLLQMCSVNSIFINNKKLSVTDH